MIHAVRNRRLETAAAYMKAYPRVTAHIICHSLGYATPTNAAMILKDAHERQENWCEWIYNCYDQDPLPAVRQTIRGRHHHKGYMAEYRLAKALVDQANATGEEPILASWF